MAFAAITDRHVAGNSLLHRLDARAKLVMALGLIFSLIFTPQAHWAVFGLYGGLIVVGIALSGLAPRLVFGRSLLALPFALAAVPVLFNHPGDELFSVPIFGWTASTEGLDRLATILLRSWLCVLTATLLTATTEADHLLRGLRSLGVPKLLVSTISFMWRYIFVIGEEAQRLITARAARSARQPGQHGGSLAWRGKVAGNMVGSLFLRSLNRSERVYIAMLARGYNGQTRTLDRFIFQRRDLAAAVATLTSVVLIQIYARI